MKIAFMQNPLTQILFFAWIYNSFIISHLLEWLKVRQIKSSIRVNFDQCDNSKACSGNYSQCNEPNGATVYCMHFAAFTYLDGTTTNTGKMIESNILFIYCRCARRPPWKTVAQWLIGALQHTGKTCLQWIRAFTASFWADSPANYWCGKHDLSQF